MSLKSSFCSVEKMSLLIKTEAIKLDDLEDIIWGNEKPRRPLCLTLSISRYCGKKQKEKGRGRKLGNFFSFTFHEVYL